MKCTKPDLIYIKLNFVLLNFCRVFVHSSFRTIKNVTRGWNLLANEKIQSIYSAFFGFVLLFFKDLQSNIQIMVNNETRSS